MGWRRSALGFIAPVLAFAVAIGAPVVAQAYGDWPNVVVPFSVAGTLTAPSYFWGCELHLHRAQSIVATLSTSSGLVKVDFRASSPQTPYFLLGDPTASPQVLPVSGDSSETCWLMITASKPGTFTLGVANASPLKAKLRGITARKTVHRGRRFRVQTSLSDYDGFWSPIRFFVERRRHNKWKAYRSARGDDVFGKNDMGDWHYDTFFKLPRGKYRVRARIRDAAHPKATFDRWQTIKVG